MAGPARRLYILASGGVYQDVIGSTEAVARTLEIPRPISNRKFLLLLGPLALCLAIFTGVIAASIVAYAGPGATAYGSDFALFYEAAKATEVGQNPYGANTLWHREQASFRRLPNKSLAHVGNPPVLFWALRPLTALPFRVAAVIWTTCMYLVSLLGFLMLLRWLGWRRRAFPIAIFLAMPQVLFQLYCGNVAALIFGTIAVAIVSRRSHPVLSGAALSVCWLKPHIALPAVLLIWAFHAESPKKLSLGFFAASSLFWAVNFGLVGFSGLQAWAAGLLGYSKGIAGQPEIASFAGLYYRWAPLEVRTVLGAAALFVAVVATFIAWRKFRDRPPDSPEVLWLWFLWMLCVPYAHVNDEILLAFPVLLLLGRNGVRTLEWPSILTLYALFSCIVVDILPGVPVGLEPAKLLVATGALVWAGRTRKADANSETVPAAKAPRSVAPSFA